MGAVEDNSSPPVRAPAAPAGAAGAAAAGEPDAISLLGPTHEDRRTDRGVGEDLSERRIKARVNGACPLRDPLTVAPSSVYLESTFLGKRLPDSLILITLPFEVPQSL
ncbi:hypothetical protein GCM10009780_76310 [Actinomadura alba]